MKNPLGAMAFALRPLGVALTFASLAACVAATDPSPGAPGERAHVDEALEVAESFPPRVDLPLGASRDAVCGGDDGDVRGAFERYAAAKGAKISRPTGEVYKWRRENGWLTCRFCDLDGMTLSVPPSERVAIVDSTATGVTLRGPLFAARLENVYARGAAFAGAASLSAKGVDLRCSASRAALLTVTSAERTDMAGAVVGLDVHGPVRGLRLTGASATATFDADVTDVRLDGMRDAGIDFGAVTVRGTTRFDGSAWTRITTHGTVFDGGEVTSRGAHGAIAVDGALTLNGVDLSQSDGGITLDPGAAPRLRVTGGARLPVGAFGLLPDARLVAADLSGARLVVQPGERWPSEPLSLAGLRLSHGAFPAGADLSRVSLDGAHLERVVFADVTLSKNGAHASFRKAHLAQADLAQQVVDGVDFTGADLRGAKLSGATGSATFTDARAGALGPHVDDNDTALTKVTSFEGAELGTSAFRGAYLDHADFRRAGLVDADLEGAHLDWASFVDARLARGEVKNGTLRRAASAHATRWDGADLRGVDLSGVDFSAVDGQGASFVGALMCGADLRGTKLHDADLTDMRFDVDGDVRFPDGSVGPCSPGDRTGAETRSTDSRIGTACPDGGHAPAGRDGECTDAQWRVRGIPSSQCTDAEKASPLDDGGACSKHCQCQSLYCAPDGTCQDAP